VLPEFVELCSVSKFVVGETITEFLDDLTRRFTQGLSGTVARGGSGKTKEVSKAPVPRSKSAWV
jgi:hypothetical protein